MSEVLLPAVRALVERGVTIHAPSTVHIDPSVCPDRIARGVVLHPGCRITGSHTAIGPESSLGEEGPVTLDNCQLGRGVELKAGYFSSATFLDGSSMGAGAHVRPGTLLEEEASGAHTVGFKQTILLPFVTTGSLINFCDCLMAGGTSRKKHSEVGSSYVHFNFTPHQDKATPSLIGDVPRGVMLDQHPIFLGGQGGLVGPARVEFGCVVPAGVVLREDALQADRIVYPRALPAGEVKPYTTGAYRDIRRIVTNNLTYIGNIRALRCWYAFVRRGILSRTPYGEACYEGALHRLKEVESERLKRLREFAGKLNLSIQLLGQQPGAERWVRDQQAFLACWSAVEERLLADACESIGAADRDAVLEALNRASHGGSYLDTIQALAPDVRRAGVRWLQAIVDSVAGTWQPPSP